MRRYGEGKSLGTLPSAALGGACAAVIAVIMLTVSAALLLFSRDPGSHSGTGRICLLLCCFAGSFIGAKCTEKMPFTAGITGGAIFLVTVVTVALILPGKVRFIFVLPAAAAIAAGAFFGSIRRGAGRIPAFDGRRFEKYEK